jgi:hypothetical protein
MSKLFYLAVFLLVIIFIAGCNDQTSIVDSPPQELQGQDVLAKTTILDQIDAVVPYSVTQFIPCANEGAGEDVTITGTAHLNVKVFLDGNGGFHYRSSFKPLEYGGLGQETGDIYRGAGGMERQNANAGPTNIPFETTFTANYKLHGPTHINIHILAHFTYNANGELTTDFYSESIDCN